MIFASQLFVLLFTRWRPFLHCLFFIFWNVKKRYCNGKPPRCDWLSNDRSKLHHFIVFEYWLNHFVHLTYSNNFLSLIVNISKTNYQLHMVRMNESVYNLLFYNTNYILFNLFECDEGGKWKMVCKKTKSFSFCRSLITETTFKVWLKRFWI